jgi:hypothetical protein
MLDRDEVAGLRKLREATDSLYLLVSERGGPISKGAWAAGVARTDDPLPVTIA